MNSLLQVPSLLNTWAIGDCATGEMKTAVAAINNANLVYQNIVHYVQGKPLLEYKPRSIGWMNSVLGDEDGVGYYGHKIRKSDDPLVQKKCRDLNVTAWWKKLRQQQAPGALQKALSAYKVPSAIIGGSNVGMKTTTGAGDLNRGFFSTRDPCDEELII